MWNAFDALESNGVKPQINIDILLQAKRWKEVTIKEIHSEIADNWSRGFGYAAIIESNINDCPVFEFI